jgi:uncharacterized membrane protein YphA (DoxX/SURF4 family)
MATTTPRSPRKGGGGGAPAAPAKPAPPTADSRAILDLTDPRYQAFALLRIAFTVAPIAFGLDKFFNVMVDWPVYLAPWIDDIVPGSGQDFMYVVGAIEIVAGLCVAFRPRFGAYLVAAWLGGIIFNLLTYSGYYDIALRDFGLMLGALTLGRLAVFYDAPTTAEGVR